MSNFYKLFDINYYAFSSLSILVALLTFMLGLNDKNPTMTTQMLTIRGTVENFDYKPTDNQKYTYLIKIQGLKNDLQIPAKYLSIFNKETFELNAVKKENINFLILKKGEQKLNEKSKISLFGIYTNSEVMLDFNKVLQVNKNLRKTYPLISSIFLILGIVYFIVRKFFWTPQK